MARSTTPRHSRKKTEPITIDLEAENKPDIKVDAKEVKNSAQEKAGDDKTAAQGSPTAKTNERDLKSSSSSLNEKIESNDKKPFTGASSSDEQKAKGQTSSTLMGGIVGGLTVAVILGGLAWSGQLPVDLMQESDAEQQSIKNDIIHLQATISQLEKDQNGALAVSDQFGKITARVGALENEVNGLSSSVVPAGNLSKLETQIRAILTPELAALKGEIEKIATPGEPKIKTAHSSEAALTALTIRLNDLGFQVETIKSKLADDIDNLVKLNSALQAVRENVNVQFSEIEKMVDNGASQRSLVKTVAVSSLQNAIDRGGSFSFELSTFAQVGGEKSIVDELTKYAADGIATPEDLLEDFKSIATELIASSKDGEAPKGIFDRLSESALSLVKVRKVGKIEGSSAEAVVARIEYYLKGENLSSAIKEFDNLSESNRALVEDIKARINARLSVDRLLADALASYANSGDK